jgi:Tol biopolymer transport system component
MAALRCASALSVASCLACGEGSPGQPNNGDNGGHEDTVLAGVIVIRGEEPNGINTRGIFRLNADGTDVRRLSQALDFNPRLSSDGTQIAFARVAGGGGDDLYVMEVEGAGLRKLTALPMPSRLELEWSPNGDWILACGDEGPWLLFRPDGSAVDTLLANPGRSFSMPDGAPWAPDASQVFFEKDEGGPWPNIYTISLATRQERLIVENGEWPFVAPSLGRVFFRRETDNVLWSCDLNGGDARRCWEVGQDVGISPDRTRVVFHVGTEEVRVLDLATCDSRRVYGCSQPSDPCVWQPVSWSPDGKHVLYRYRSEGVDWDKLFVLTVASGLLRDISNGLPELTIDPDGDWSVAQR